MTEKLFTGTLNQNQNKTKTLKGDKNNKRVWKLVKTNAEIRTQIKDRVNIISSPEPLGSQGELIVYASSRRPSYVVRRTSSVCRPQCSNIFSSETAGPIKAKFYEEPPWVGGTKVYINGPGHMTKMAATPIYGKNPSKIFFSRTGGPIFTKLGM